LRIRISEYHNYNKNNVKNSMIINHQWNNHDFLLRCTNIADSLQEKYITNTLYQETNQ